MIKHMEVTFHCHACGKAVEFDKTKQVCEYCGHHLMWGHVHKSYSDKYTDIFQILI